MIFYTACNDSYFQYYLPVYAHCVKKAYPECKVMTTIYGKMDSAVSDAIEYLNVTWDNSIEIIEKPWLGVHGDSTFNTLRFIDCPKVSEPMLITDIDLMFFNHEPTHYQYHDIMAGSLGGDYYAHHAPWKKPERFPGGWKGEKERIAGGLVYVKPEWWEKTESIRKKYMGKLLIGEIGTYREEDEVVLCKILKEAGYRITSSKHLPTQYRGIHLGDFKDSMQHRYDNIENMKKRLHIKCVEAYKNAIEEDHLFSAMINVAKQVPEIKNQFDRLYKYCIQKWWFAAYY